MVFMFCRTLNTDLKHGTTQIRSSQVFSRSYFYKKKKFLIVYFFFFAFYKIETGFQVWIMLQKFLIRIVMLL